MTLAVQRNKEAILRVRIRVLECGRIGALQCISYFQSLRYRSVTQNAGDGTGDMRDWTADELKSIAERLRRARITAGFERASDAARRFGWSYSRYMNYENGERGRPTQAGDPVRLSLWRHRRLYLFWKKR